jgi:hypothetical protein
MTSPGARGRRTAVAALTLVLGLLAAGCTTVTQGNGRSAPGLTLGPLEGALLYDVLPTEADMDDILDSPLREDSEGELSGGVDDMPDGLNSERRASPHRCVTAIAPIQRSMYVDTDATEFASRKWRLPKGEKGDIMGVHAAVVVFPDHAAASAAYDEFVKDWQDCDGGTVRLGQLSERDHFVEKINDVRQNKAVAVADILTSQPSTSISWRRQRALAVRANCLIEVDVSYYSDKRPPSDLQDAAAQVADFMLDRITDVG